MKNYSDGLPSAKIFVGTAAWSVPSAAAPFFGTGKSHLERYSQRLKGVEINTSFYRDHKAATYEKWALMTPDDFRFVVKLSRVFTHDQGLVVEAAQLREVLESIMKLGEKLAVILIQLPPKLAFDEQVARRFFQELRKINTGAIAFEPRHKTWVSASALEVLKEFNVGKVMADPEPCPSDFRFQASTEDCCYLRWHGSPVIYESRYAGEELLKLKEYVRSIRNRFRSIWIIFDNTTFGWATVNAIEMQNLLSADDKTFEALEIQPRA